MRLLKKDDYKTKKAVKQKMTVRHKIEKTMIKIKSVNEKTVR